MLKVLTVFGTRPEAIKMASVIAELERHGSIIRNRNCFTGQHRDMVQSLIQLFGIRVDYDLDLMRVDQTLEYITTSVLEQVGEILRRDEYDYVLVQGDTTTSMAASLAAFYNGVRVGHVEAGLRTYDKLQPYPEEVNRRIIDSTADLFFARVNQVRLNVEGRQPVPGCDVLAIVRHARRNRAAALDAVVHDAVRAVILDLLREGVAAERIAVTGNTVIDALLDVARRPYSFEDDVLRSVAGDHRKLVLVTAHRRESFGEQFESICAGLRAVAHRYPDDVVIVYPVHRNPNVRKVVERALSGVRNVVLTEPLDYVPFVHLMKRAYMVITDSGGIQEEAPSLDKPVLVLRNVTERQEGLAAGTIKLVGTESDQIVAHASRLLDDAAAHADMASRRNPYGDGTAGRRTVAKLLESCGFSSADMRNSALAPT